mmetsp:Transcript_51826/g.82337  ORF Transcript_51826/g.82337 Transcript_51826/m.82337 type:complete len:1053 (-) Transcript_51826:169-3327(-)
MAECYDPSQLCIDELNTKALIETEMQSRSCSQPEAIQSMLLTLESQLSDAEANGNYEEIVRITSAVREMAKRGVLKKSDNVCWLARLPPKQEMPANNKSDETEAIKTLRFLGAYREIPPLLTGNQLGLLRSVQHQPVLTNHDSANYYKLVLAGGPEQLLGKVLDHADKYICSKGTRSAGSVRKVNGFGTLHAPCIAQICPTASRPYVPTAAMLNTLETGVWPRTPFRKFVKDGIVIPVGDYKTGLKLDLNWSSYGVRVNGAAGPGIRFRLTGKSTKKSVFAEANAEATALFDEWKEGRLPSAMAAKGPIFRLLVEKAKLDRGEIEKLGCKWRTYLEGDCTKAMLYSWFIQQYTQSLASVLEDPSSSLLLNLSWVDWNTMRLDLLEPAILNKKSRDKLLIVGDNWLYGTVRKPSSSTKGFEKVWFKGDIPASDCKVPDTAAPVLAERISRIGGVSMTPEKVKQNKQKWRDLASAMACDAFHPSMVSLAGTFEQSFHFLFSGEVTTTLATTDWWLYVFAEIEASCRRRAIPLTIEAISEGFRAFGVTLKDSEMVAQPWCDLAINGHFRKPLVLTDGSVLRVPEDFSNSDFAGKIVKFPHLGNERLCVCFLLPLQSFDPDSGSTKETKSGDVQSMRYASLLLEGGMCPDGEVGQTLKEAIYKRYQETAINGVNVNRTPGELAALCGSPIDADHENHFGRGGELVSFVKKPCWQSYISLFYPGLWACLSDEVKSLLPPFYRKESRLNPESGVLGRSVAVTESAATNIAHRKFHSEINKDFFGFDPALSASDAVQLAVELDERGGDAIAGDTELVDGASGLHEVSVVAPSVKQLRALRKKALRDGAVDAALFRTIQSQNTTDPGFKAILAASAKRRARGAKAVLKGKSRAAKQAEKSDGTKGKKAGKKAASVKSEKPDTDVASASTSKKKKRKKVGASQRRVVLKKMISKKRSASVSPDQSAHPPTRVSKTGNDKPVEGDSAEATSVDFEDVARPRKATGIARVMHDPKRKDAVPAVLSHLGVTKMTEAVKALKTKDGSSRREAEVKFWSLVEQFST